MWHKFVTKRRVVVVLTSVLALAIVSGAFAYFTGDGSFTGSAGAVGSAANYSVSFGTPTGNMYPGNGSDTIPYTITNTGNGTQQVSSVTAIVDSDANEDITVGDTGVSGCQADWFAVSAPGTLSTPVTLAPSGHSGDSYSGTITVTMKNSQTNQNSCQGQTPDITVHAS